VPAAAFDPLSSSGASAALPHAVPVSVGAASDVLGNAIAARPEPPGAPADARPTVVGGERWFAAQLAIHRPDVYRLLRWLSRDSLQAEDLTQDTLLRAWRFRSTLDRRASIKLWLLTIARREYARSGERKHLTTVELGDIPEHQTPSCRDGCPAEVAEIESAIGALSPPAREVVVLRALFGYSVREIAMLSGTPTPVVSTRLFRARRTLGQLLGRDLTPAADGPGSSARG
jgi:RNA polymerase sigma-70 factor (ECF subfamily)